MASIDRAGHDVREPACRRVGLVGLRVLAVLLATAVLGTWGQAAPVAAEQVDPRVGDWGVDAVLGVGGQVVGDTWKPVTVTLHPEQPFRGRILMMNARGGSTTLQSRAVEVPAGVEKRYVLLAPPSLHVQVQVVEDGTDEAVTLQPRAEQANGFLVGVLGASDPAALPPVTLPMTDQRATSVSVDDALLEMGPRALQSLATLVVRQSDLADLSEPARRAVAARVAEGATLVVTGATDPDLGLPWRAFTDRTEAGLSPLPGAWAAQAAALVDPAGQPPPSQGGDTPADVVAIAAGRGRVVATTLEVGGPGAASDQVLWEDLLQPDQHAVAAGNSRRFDDLPHDIERAFGDSAGEPPSFAWLAIFFVVYVVVTGPVLGMVLSRRRRPELAWVVVPVVTALFAGAAFVGATGARPRVGVGARVATWVDGVGTTMAVAGVRAPQAGQHTITLPGTGWDVSTASRSAVRLAEGADTVATVRVPSHSLGAVVGWRSLDQDPPLDVEVALFDTEARVEITNTSGQDLGTPTVRLATESHELAANLPAGETLVETIRLPDALTRQRDPFNEGVRGPFDMPGGPEDLAILARWQLLDRSPGMAIVTATSEGDLELGVASVDGTAPTELGTLVAVGVTPSVTDDTTTPFEVRRDLVATGRGAHHDMPLTLSGPGPATMRFRLPHEGAVESLSLALEHHMGRFGGGVEPLPPQPQPIERCGLLERRDADTGDVLEATDVCAPDFPCPPDAETCSWSDDGGNRFEGEACFPDGSCQELIWTVDGGQAFAEAAPTFIPEEVPQPVPTVTATELPPGEAPPLPRELPPPPPDVRAFSGMQVWDHLDRRWVDVPAGQDVTDEGATRWLSPLGEVWVRATGELAPFDLAPQGVSARLEGPR